MADRDILFKIGVVDHEQTGPRLKALGDAVRGTMADVEKSISSVGRAASTETARIARSAGSARDAVGATVGGSSSRVNVGPTSAVPDYNRQADSLRRYSAEAARVKDQLSRIDSESAKVGQSLAGVSRDFFNSVNSTAEGIGRLASGVTLLTAGNDDAKKLIDTLLTAKGAIDIGVGLVKTFTSVASVFSTASERQELLNTQTRLGAERVRVATSVRREYVTTLTREAAALDRVATSTRNLDRAQDSLRSNPVGARGSGRASVASSAAVEGITGGNVGHAVGIAAIVIAIERAFGSAFARRAGAAATRSATGIVGSSIGSTAALLGPVGAAGLAFTSVAAAGKGIVEAFDGTAGAADSVTARFRYLGETLLRIPYDDIGSFLATMANYAGRLSGLSDLVGDTATSRLGARTSSAIDARRQVEERARLFGQFGFDARQQIRAGQSQIDDLRVQVAPVGQQNSLRFQLLSQDQVRTSRELAVAVGTLNSAAAGAAVSSEDLGIAYDRAKTVGQQLADIQGQQLGLVKQEADIRRQSATGQLQAAQERLATEKETIRTTKEGLLSAQERFAQLSKEDQLRAKRAAQQARVDPESLTDAQRSLLRRVGDESSITAARRADIAEANRAGFGQFFGATERGQIAAAQVRAQQAQVQIQDQTRIQIDITRREKTLVDALARQTIAAIQASNRRMAAQFQSQIDASIEANNRAELQKNQANRAR